MLDGVRRVERGAFAQLLGQGTARQLQHGQQFGAFGRPQALDALQVVGRGVQQAGHAAEAGAFVQQLLRQLQHAFAGQAGAQQQGQQFGVAQGAGATGQQLFARARVGGKVFERHDGRQ